MRTDRGERKRRVDFTLAVDCPAASGIVATGLSGLEQNLEVDELVGGELMTLFENEVDQLY